MLLPGDFAYEQRQGLQISRAAVASQEDHRVDKAVLAWVRLQETEDQTS